MRCLPAGHRKRSEVEITWVINVTKSKRRVFDASFKLQVVEMIRAQGPSIGHVDMALGETLAFTSMNCY